MLIICSRFLQAFIRVRCLKEDRCFLNWPFALTESLLHIIPQIFIALQVYPNIKYVPTKKKTGRNYSCTQNFPKNQYFLLPDTHTFLQNSCAYERDNPSIFYRADSNKLDSLPSHLSIFWSSLCFS